MSPFQTVSSCNERLPVHYNDEKAITREMVLRRQFTYECPPGCLLALVLVDGPGELVALVDLVARVFPPTGVGTFVSSCCLFLFVLVGSFAPSPSPSPLRSYIFLVSGDTWSRQTYCLSGPTTHCVLHILHPWHLHSPQVSYLGQWNRLAQLRGLRESFQLSYVC